MKRPTTNAPQAAPIPKLRSIQFAKFPPGQVPEAVDMLKRLGDVDVAAHDPARTIDIAYDLRRHRLQEIEGDLEDRGYHLDNTLLSKMRRALIYYVEETQLHNLDAPKKLLKRSQSEAYTHAWERHPHGDHDETPPEWRDYK